MIQIIHLSDFHLNEKNFSDWKSFIKKAFIEKIKLLDIDLTQTIIVCTGDLIDKGNLNFDKTKQSFELFKEEVIDVICEELSMPIERFFIVAGNHDMVRSNDSKKIEMGNREYYKNYDNILSSIKEILDKDEREGVRRNIPFFEFNTSLYKNIEQYNKYFSFLGNAFVCEINNMKIGVSCLNSSWRSYDDTDKDYLILGEEQLNRCTNFIKDCDIKIALMHHPLDWFKLEKNIISEHINKDYDMLFVGHVHEATTITQTGFSGTLFTNIAPSYVSEIRDDNKAFSNGFSIIKYDNTNKEIDCNYYIYKHEKKEFIINSNMGENGRKIFEIPNQNITSTHALIERSLKNIQDDFYKIMDEHIIAQKINILNNIKDAFIMPPLTDQRLSDKDITYLTLDEICKSKQNICIFGPQEIGKTTLLYRITRELVDEYSLIRKIPVFIDVREMGNKEINTCIKDFLRCSSDDTKLLISENHIVLLIDNLDYNEINKDKINRINNFNSENQEIRIIATTDNNIESVPSETHIKNIVIPFRNLYLQTLKSYHIKGLMTKWLPQDDNNKREDKLEKMVNNFCSYSLPCTAMSVSLFLWSTENSDKKPINQAILLDIYIEIVLEKLAKENIYRDTFDYKNKTMLLAKVAQEMLKSKEANYAIPYTEYIKIISDYINTVGFDYDVSRIADYFIERKIFSKISNSIKFSHSCFFHFFIAKRMENDATFKNEVLKENFYYMFPRELDYYTGLIRNDKETLEIIYGRFKEAFRGVEEILEHVDVDRYFTYIVKNQTPHVSVSKYIDTDKIKDNRPTEEKILEFYDNKLSKKTSDAIVRKIDSVNLELLLIIMSNVLRNSEGVEDYKLKSEIYNSIIRNTIAWVVLYKEWIVRFIKDNNTLPPFINQEQNIVNFLRMLPFNVQGGINHHLGTNKLTKAMNDKIQQDKTDKKCSDIEKYFSVGLYWDNQGKDKFKPFKELIKSLSNNIAQDYCTYKLMDYFYRKTAPNSQEEQLCIELLSRLKLKTEKLPQRLKGNIMLEFKERKRKFNL
ncbi:MAG TPA: metallophosphoesterase [Bacteroidales bacterium]|nr:metallophosphoesterase [Bacteroidales bacterium]